MYLFSRRAHLNSMAGMEWATTILGRVNEVNGGRTQLWANAYSPGFGTVSWTSWLPDLASLEADMTALQGDAKFLALAAEGQTFIDGTIDDALLQTVSGEPDPSTADQNKLVSGVQAVCAAGNIARAMTVGTEITQRAEAISGVRTLFVRGLTGPYGAVGWLSAYPDLAAFETAQDKLAVDPGWLTLIDSTKGCFVEDAAITQQTLYSRLA
jgi:hypothetical protein